MKTHKIIKGETMASIAKRFSVDIADLASANNITDINKIREGKWLQIPDKKLKQQPETTKVHPIPKEKVAQADEKPISELWEDTLFRGREIAEKWLTELLARLRAAEADEYIQDTHKVPLTSDKVPPTHTPELPKKPNSESKKKVTDVKKVLKEKLGKEPHVLTFNGVRLTENEKKQILASVATCEMNSDGFGSINSDQEFVGRKNGKKGIETTYSRIVHIGLSYGVIQYTQDSGSLGDLLKCLRAKNPSLFAEIFGAGYPEFSDALIQLTTTGRPDLAQNTQIPLSGQAYWNQIHNTPAGNELKMLANSQSGSHLPTAREIRGKRVQPIAPSIGHPPIDLWKGEWRDRFLSAGKVVDFQEAQLEYGVRNFINPMLSLAKHNNVRSALALAFIAACNIRGGVGSKLSKLTYRVAKELGLALPFVSSEDELACMQAIAEAHGSIGAVSVHEDESRRAKRLIDDELGFLAEDLYDISTYA
ncbi:LysM peptidoglycan-binding domain-containing protein [Pseudoduganella lutea]|uniref:LysM domain-containing protein n=1 Tax=Pseudoduganella lutea TaxID=321985 RepID=A0A4P6L382_9BURK|nr:LysM domain-containing protein [Pseudoduganella lutea]QBE65931.1 LysM domain-containing protein [Pseudoduganella lutea]